MVARASGNAVVTDKGLPGEDFGLQACLRAGPVYLSVGPIKPGVGTING